MRAPRADPGDGSCFLSQVATRGAGVTGPVSAFPDERWYNKNDDNNAAGSGSSHKALMTPKTKPKLVLLIKSLESRKSRIATLTVVLLQGKPVLNSPPMISFSPHVPTSSTPRLVLCSAWISLTRKAPSTPHLHLTLSPQVSGRCACFHFLFCCSCLNSYTMTPLFWSSFSCMTIVGHHILSRYTGKEQVAQIMPT